MSGWVWHIRVIPVMFLESSSDSSFLELDGLLQVETPTHKIAFLSGYIIFFAILHFAFAVLTGGKYVHFPFPDKEESIT